MNKSTFEHFMRKVNRNESGILSVAAMRGKYVWLNEELEIPNRGTITFEAKGNNDICICLHTDSSSVVIGRDGLPDGSPVYEILFGGWSNSKSAIRKHGIQQRFITKSDNEDAVIHSTTEFLSYWITIFDDWVYAGVGEVGCNEILRWQDTKATSSVKCIGFSSWNTPLQFKNILVGPPFVPKIHTFELNGKEILESEILSDNLLTVENTQFSVHNAILYCWNKNFIPNNILEGEINEEDIQISNIYCKDKLNNNESILIVDDNINNEENNNISSLENHQFYNIQNSDENIWNNLPAILVKRVLQFLYSGTTGDLSHRELVQLMNFAIKYSLTSFLSFLQKLTSDDTNVHSNSIEEIIKSIICFKPLLRNKLYSDIIIECDGDTVFEKKQVYAHRVILAFWSNPFKAMFSYQMKESFQKEIYLPEVDYRDFKIFLEFCYTGNVYIPPQRAIPTLILADRYQVTPLQENCCDVVVKYIDVDNCCSLLEMASLYNWKTLRAHCIRFIETNFKRIVQKTDEFVKISPDALLELILSDDLMVSEEFQVFEAFEKWSEYQYPKREKEHKSHLKLLVDLICCIRFPLISKTILIEKISKHFLYNESKRFRNEIKNSLKYIKYTEHGNYNENINKQQQVFELLDNFKKRPRTVYKHHQLLFSHSGDKNGVCYFLGCNLGKNLIWQNPHKAKRLTITLSSPPSRYSKAELLVNRTFSTTNYATGNPPWCMIDFGEGHELICNHYTLKLDNSDFIFCNWLLQGANNIKNDDNWVTLRIHKDESLFKDADWAVFGRYASFPYRYFRIIAIPPITKIGISSIEFYGYYK